MSKSKDILNSIKLITVASFLAKCLGLLSLPILARLLTPADFGIVALASTIVYLADIFSESGAQKYISSKYKVSQSEVASAWTLNLIFKVGTVFIVYIVILVISDWLATEVVIAVLVISLGLVFQALMSPKLLLCKKHLLFSVVAKIQVTQKIISFLTTITLAYILESYMAMVIGVFVHFASGLLLSYLIFPSLPQFSCKEFKNQVTFSKLIYIQSIIGYIRSEVDIFLASLFFNLQTVGGYSTTKEISTLPGRDIISPLTEPILSIFSKQDSLQKKQLMLQKFLIIFGLLALPISLFVAVYAQFIVVFLLGYQWEEYAILLSMFSLIIFQYSQYAILEEYFISQGYLKKLYYFELTLTFILILSLCAVLLLDDVYVFALSRVIFSVVSIFCLFILLFRIEKFSPLKLASYQIFGFGIAFLCMALTSQLPISGVWVIINAAIFYGLYLTSCVLIVLLNYLLIQRKTANPENITSYMMNFSIKKLKKTVIEHQF